MSSIGAVGSANSPQIVSGASPWSSPATKYNNLFSQIDSGNTGSINQSQFNEAFTTLNPPGIFKAAGVSAVFSQLDPSNAGSVSRSDFVSRLSSLAKHLRSGQADSKSAAAPSPSETLASNLQSLNSLGGSGDASQNDGIGANVNLIA